MPNKKAKLRKQDRKRKNLEIKKHKRLLKQQRKTLAKKGKVK